MFGHLTKSIEDRVINQAIDQLGKDGKTGLSGIGHLQYDYDRNVVTMYADPQMVEKVRKSWEKHHHIRD